MHREAGPFEKPSHWHDTIIHTHDLIFLYGRLLFSMNQLSDWDIWVLRVQMEQPFWHMPLQSASFGLESQTPWPQETRKFEKQLFKNWPKGLVWWWNTFNPTSREGEAGASLWVWDQTGPHRQTLSQKQKQIKMDTRGWEMAQLEKCVLCLF